MEHVTHPSDGQTRLLMTLEQLLGIQALDLSSALDQASQSIAEALQADKVDAFLHDPAIASLVAVGSSATPMARLQHQLGLATMPLANGGYSVEVFRDGTLYHTGQADHDAKIPIGIWQSLGARSIISVPLAVAGERRGTLEAVSKERDRFSSKDLAFLEAVAHWVGTIAHRAELAEHLANAAAARARHVAAEELIAVLAHDLRTPLTPARGYLDLLRRRALKDERQQDIEYADQISLALRRLNRMIEALLDASRLEQGMFSLVPRPVDLAYVVRETARTLELPETPIRVEAPEELAVARVDPERLRQALENLIGNAVAHSPARTPVVITLALESRDEAPWAVLRVHNDGEGIDPSILPTLFERFARGAGSTGLGLGLYLARGIAEAHGGTLTLDPAVRSGVTFALALPLAETPAALMQAIGL